MTTFCTARSVFTTLLLAIAQFCSAQVFWTETFSDQSAATANWHTGGTNGGTEVWNWSNDPGLSVFGTSPFIAPTAADGFFLFDSDANGEFPHDITLTSAPINCSASINTHFSFWAQYAYYSSNPQAALEVSIDSGATWTTHLLFQGLAVETFFNDSSNVDLPEANGQPLVILRFRWAGNYEFSWKVDDLTLESSPATCEQNPNSLICDALDNYDPALLLGPQSAWWTTWFGAEGGANDANVSTEQASSTPNSVKVVSTSNGGGLQSAILQLGQVDSGYFELKFKMFIPANKTAYYDLRQAIPIVFGGNNLNVYFDSTGTGTLKNSSSVAQASFAFPQDEWFTCKHRFDLNDNTQTYWINDVLVDTTPFTGNLGGVLFMGANAKSVFYIDDVAFATYVPDPPVVLTVDDCDGAIDLNTLFGSLPGVAQTSARYDNTTATRAASDPVAPACFQDGVPDVAPTIDGSLWYTFTGDGNKYHLETVPCDAKNYITDGDTQMAIYSGDCGDFTELLCNEDLTGADDYRAGLDIETVENINYHVLIDGWSDPASGYVATGEFCLEVTRLISVSCGETVLDTFAAFNDHFVCNASSTEAMFDFEAENFILPTMGTVHGFSWAVSSEPIAPGTWPPAMPGYWGSFAVLPQVYAPNLTNNGTFLTQDQVWYFTPVAIANAVDQNLANPAYLHELDISSACFYTGESVGLYLLKELAPLVIIPTATPATAGNTDGAIDLTVSGGIFDQLQVAALSYSVDWSGPNGFTSQDEDLLGLAPGTYTASVNDLKGCVEPVTVSVEITATSATKDPTALKSLLISPNPTANTTRIDLRLAKVAELQIEVVNPFGQTLQVLAAGKVNTLQQGH